MRPTDIPREPARTRQACAAGAATMALAVALAVGLAPARASAQAGDPVRSCEDRAAGMRLTGEPRQRYVTWCLRAGLAQAEPRAAAAAAGATPVAVPQIAGGGAPQRPPPR